MKTKKHYKKSIKQKRTKKVQNQKKTKNNLMDGWTEVRRGRRPQRTRQFDWDRGDGRYMGRMDRAPFFPFRGRAQTHRPNPNLNSLSSRLILSLIL